MGPQPDGTIQPEFKDRLREIGEWLSVNGESIYETTYGPIQGVASLRTTMKGKSVFVHVFDWPTGTLELTGVNAKVISARMLANGEPVTFEQSERSLQIKLPKQAPGSVVNVVALKTL